MAGLQLYLIVNIITTCQIGKKDYMEIQQNTISLIRLWVTFYKFSYLYISVN